MIDNIYRGNHKTYKNKMKRDSLPSKMDFNFSSFLNLLNNCIKKYEELIIFENGLQKLDS